MTNNDCVDVNIRYRRTSTNDVGPRLLTRKHSSVSCSNDNTPLDTKDDMSSYVKERFPSASLRERSISLSNCTGLDDDTSYQKRYCPCDACAEMANAKGVHEKSCNKNMILDLLQADYESYLSVDRFLSRSARHYRGGRVPLVMGERRKSLMCCERRSVCNRMSITMDEHEVDNVDVPLTRSKSDTNISDINKTHSRENSQGSLRRNISVLLPNSNSKSNKPGKKKKTSKSSFTITSSKPNSPVSPAFQYIPRSTPKYVLCAFCNRVYSHRSMEIHSRQCKKRFVPRKRLGMKFGKELESPSMVKLCEENKKTLKRGGLKKKASLHKVNKDLISCCLVDLGKHGEKPTKSNNTPQKELPSSQDHLPTIHGNEKLTPPDKTKHTEKVEPDLPKANKPRRPRRVKRRSLSEEKYTVNKKNVEQKEGNHFNPHPPLFRMCFLCGEMYGSKLKTAHDRQCPMKAKKDTVEKEKTDKKNVDLKESNQLIPHPPEFRKCRTCGEMYGSRSLSIHEKKCSGEENKKYKVGNGSSKENKEINIEELLP